VKKIGNLEEENRFLKSRVVAYEKFKQNY